MKKAPNAKIGCKSCDPLLENNWIDESGFKLKPIDKNQSSKVTNIIKETKKKTSSKIVSLF